MPNETFEWDEEKNRANRTKHGVGFELAQRAFLDPRRIILRDRSHGDEESRFFCLGEIDGLVMTVRFTWREERIRIFGAQATGAKAERSMSRKTAEYTDDRGEMNGLGPRVEDFLPPPDRLVLRDDAVKVTLSLSQRSVEFFKREAAKQRVPYQRMIRALVDEYVKRHSG